MCEMSKHMYNFPWQHSKVDNSKWTTLQRLDYLQAQLETSHIFDRLVLRLLYTTLLC